MCCSLSARRGRPLTSTRALVPIYAGSVETVARRRVETIAARRRVVRLVAQVNPMLAREVSTCNTDPEAFSQLLPVVWSVLPSRAHAASW